MGIEKVAVIGTGIMGKGIAQVCARSGYDIYIKSRSAESAKTAIDSIRSMLNKRSQNGKITELEKENILGRIKGVSRFDDVGECDLVIETVIEVFEEKKEVFSALSDTCRENTIFTSNTSSISINKIAANIKRPERVLGTHFFDPANSTKVVEIITTFFSDEESLQVVNDFLHSIGKETIICRDMPGFVINRIWMAFVLEAIRVLEAGIATVEDIDKGMSLGFQHPWGPLMVADAAGLDSVYRVACILFEEFKDPKFAPPPLLQRMVTAGFYGRKSGRGFYKYE